jgi:hypothetical protein
VGKSYNKKFKVQKASAILSQRKVEFYYFFLPFESVKVEHYFALRVEP